MMQSAGAVGLVASAAALGVLLWAAEGRAQWEVGETLDTRDPEPAAPSAPEPPPVTPSPAPPRLAWADLAQKSELEKRLEQTRALSDRVTQSLEQMRRHAKLAESQARRYAEQIKAWEAALDVVAARVSEVKAELLVADARTVRAEPSADDAKASDRSLLAAVAAAKAGLLAIGSELTSLESTTGWHLVGTLLHARCATAICFDNGSAKNWLGIEPLVELPVGTSFAFGSSSLSDHVNNQGIRVELAAGARVWLFRDLVSLSLYVSKPLTDTRVRLEGSTFVYPASALRRPYPGLALGLLFDSIWLGLDRNELRNGDGQDTGAANPDFPPNSRVSAAWSLSVAIEPVTALRSAIGTAVQASREGGAGLE